MLCGRINFLEILMMRAAWNSVVEQTVYSVLFEDRMNTHLCSVSKDKVNK